MNGCDNKAMGYYFNILCITLSLKCMLGLGFTVGGNLSVSGYNSTENTEGLSLLSTSPEYTFPFCGIVKHWKILSIGEGKLWLQIWRPHKAMSYRLIQEISVYTTGASTIQQIPPMNPTTSPDIIHFYKGDVIGWKYNEKEIIPFRSSPVIARGHGFWRRRVSHGDGVTENWGQGEFLYARQYAISASVSENTPPYFEKDGIPASTFTVTIGDASDPYTQVMTLPVKDREETLTLRISMSTKSLYFSLNETSYTIYTLQWLKVGQYSTEIQVTDYCGKSASAQIFISVVESNPTTTQEMFLGRPAIVWTVGLPMSLGLSVMCLGSLFVYSCIQWKKGSTFPVTELK
ncbi:uncharacterized protein LOC134267969 [Saccostrea cucullata]|uniref:uncharacterized protein LOC134267969 n=1 Tax=Saccostrea cuccullata TaxID=36930 RepID=UPI002ED0933A